MYLCYRRHPWGKLSSRGPPYPNNPSIFERGLLGFLGDYIDRGEDSKGVIDRILGFKSQHPKQVICLKGNHEQWFLETYQNYRSISWLFSMEGLSTIRSYSPIAQDTIQDFILKQKQKVLIEKPLIPYQEFFSSIPMDHMAFFKT